MTGHIDDNDITLFPVLEIYDWFGEKVSTYISPRLAGMHSFIYIILEKLRNIYLRTVSALPMPILLFDSAILIV